MSSNSADQDDADSCRHSVLQRPTSGPDINMDDDRSVFVPGTYDIANTTSQLILLNSSQPKDRSHLRDLCELPQQMSAPDPQRHMRGSQTNLRRHTKCKDSQSPRYEPPYSLDWASSRPQSSAAQTSDQQTSVPTSDAETARSSSSNGKRSARGGPSSRRAKSARYRRDYTRMTINEIYQQELRPARLLKRAQLPRWFAHERPVPPYLIHPELESGNKHNLWSMASIYSVADLKARKQLQYQMALAKEAAKGDYDKREVEQYRHYLMSPRKNQYGQTTNTTPATPQRPKTAPTSRSQSSRTGSSSSKQKVNRESTGTDDSEQINYKFIDRSGSIHDPDDSEPSSRVLSRNSSVLREILAEEPVEPSAPRGMSRRNIRTLGPKHKNKGESEKKAELERRKTEDSIPEQHEPDVDSEVVEHKTEDVIEEAMSRDSSRTTTPCSTARSDRSEEPRSLRLTSETSTARDDSVVKTHGGRRYRPLATERDEAVLNQVIYNLTSGSHPASAVSSKHSSRAGSRKSSRASSRQGSRVSSRQASIVSSRQSSRPSSRQSSRPSSRLSVASRSDSAGSSAKSSARSSRGSSPTQQTTNSLFLTSGERNSRPSSASSNASSRVSTGSKASSKASSRISKASSHQSEVKAVSSRASSRKSSVTSVESGPRAVSPVAALTHSSHPISSYSPVTVESRSESYERRTDPNMRFSALPKPQSSIERPPLKRSYSYSKTSMSLKQAVKLIESAYIARDTRRKMAGDDDLEAADITEADPSEASSTQKSTSSVRSEEKITYDNWNSQNRVDPVLEQFLFEDPEVSNDKISTAEVKYDNDKESDSHSAIANMQMDLIYANSNQESDYPKRTEELPGDNYQSEMRQHELLQSPINRKESDEEQKMERRSSKSSSSSSSSTSADEDLEENETLEEQKDEAASILQAGFRGFLERKERERVQAASESNQSLTKGSYGRALSFDSNASSGKASPHTLHSDRDNADNLTLKVPVAMMRRSSLSSNSSTDASEKSKGSDRSTISKKSDSSTGSKEKHIEDDIQQFFAVPIGHERHDSEKTTEATPDAEDVNTSKGNNEYANSVQGGVADSLDDENSDIDEAATILQAGFRGFLQRKVSTAQKEDNLLEIEEKGHTSTGSVRSDSSGDESTSTSSSESDLEKQDSKRSIRSESLNSDSDKDAILTVGSATVNSEGTVEEDVNTTKTVTKHEETMDDSSSKDNFEAKSQTTRKVSFQDEVFVTRTYSADGQSNGSEVSHDDATPKENFKMDVSTGSIEGNNHGLEPANSGSVDPLPTDPKDFSNNKDQSDEVGSSASNHGILVTERQASQDSRVSQISQQDSYKAESRSYNLNEDEQSRRNGLNYENSFFITHSQQEHQSSGSEGNGQEHQKDNVPETDEIAGQEIAADSIVAEKRESKPPNNDETTDVFNWRQSPALVPSSNNGKTSLSGSEIEENIEPQSSRESSLLNETRSPKGETAFNDEDASMHGGETSATNEPDTEYDSAVDNQISAALDGLTKPDKSLERRETIEFHDQAILAETPVTARFDKKSGAVRANAVTTIAKHYRGYKIRKDLKLATQDGKVKYYKRKDYSAKQSLLVYGENSQDQEDVNSSTGQYNKRDAPGIGLLELSDEDPPLP